MRRLIFLVVGLVVFLAVWNFVYPQLSKFFETLPKRPTQTSEEKVKIVTEESAVIDIVEKVAPSVVTVGVEQRVLQINPFDPFGPFRQKEGTRRDQDIGSGFIISAEGLIVTNKHVVSSRGKYKAITSDGTKYDVARIYRDPANDLAILQINPTTGSGFKPVEMGDSSNLKVGQLVVAMGTPLGEFRGTVTKGIISGLGRGITAGSPFEGFVERLDNVIQTDAAINPGNSGGPLVNSSGQVIGVNTAVASGAENIGFAIPINIVKDTLKNFNETGQFSRPYLGIVYQMVTRQLSLINKIPEGAFVRDVVEGAAADKAGVKVGDIITKIDNEKITDDEGGLAKAISTKKVGQQVVLTVWRDEKEIELKVTLGETPEE